MDHTHNDLITADTQTQNSGVRPTILHTYFHGINTRLTGFYNLTNSNASIRILDYFPKSPVIYRQSLYSESCSSKKPKRRRRQSFITMESQSQNTEPSSTASSPTRLQTESSTTDSSENIMQMDKTDSKMNKENCDPVNLKMQDLEASEQYNKYFKKKRAASIPMIESGEDVNKSKTENSLKTSGIKSELEPFKQIAYFKHKKFKRLMIYNKLVDKRPAFTSLENNLDETIPLKKRLLHNQS